MKTKLFLMLGMFAVVGMLTAGNASAGWDGGGEGGGGGGMGEMMGALGLDDAQWDKFNDLRRKYRKDTIQIQAKIDIAEVELEELADADNVDMKKLRAKIEQIANLQAQLRIYRYQALNDMRGFISQEQFDTFRWMAMKMGFDFSDDKKGGHH